LRIVCQEMPGGDQELGTIYLKREGGTILSRTHEEGPVVNIRWQQGEQIAK
jgi:hypothetical protein